MTVKAYQIASMAVSLFQVLSSVTDIISSSLAVRPDSGCTKDNRSRIYFRIKSQISFVNDEDHWILNNHHSLRTRSEYTTIRSVGVPPN